MTYNVFGGTLNLAQSIYEYLLMLFIFSVCCLCQNLLYRIYSVLWLDVIWSYWTKL